MWVRNKLFISIVIFSTTFYSVHSAFVTNTRINDASSMTCTRSSSRILPSLRESSTHQSNTVSAPETQDVKNDDIVEKFKNCAGVIFDMDGTLVQPCIDFASMRKRIYDVASNDLGYPVSEGCVVEMPSKLSSTGQDRCREIFKEIEVKAIEDMKFMPGIDKLCQLLDENNKKRAVLTRNSESSVHAMQEKLYLKHKIKPFEPIVARNTVTSPECPIPSKPSPDGIYYICQRWNCDPSAVIMVGDSKQDDITTAYRAGSASVLVYDPKEAHDNNSGNDNDSEAHERIPTITVTSLTKLYELLETRIE